MGITCLHRPGAPFTKVLYILTQTNYKWYIHKVGACWTLPQLWTSNKILESHWTLEDFAFYCKNWWSYYQDSQLFIKRTWALRALLERRMKIFSFMYQTGRQRDCCCQYQSHQFRVQNNTVLLFSPKQMKRKERTLTRATWMIWYLQKMSVKFLNNLCHL